MENETMEKISLWGYPEENGISQVDCTVVTRWHTPLEQLKRVDERTIYKDGGKLKGSLRRWGSTTMEAFSPIILKLANGGGHVLGPGKGRDGRDCPARDFVFDHDRHCCGLDWREPERWYPLSDLLIPHGYTHRKQGSPVNATQWGQHLRHMQGGREIK